MSSWERFKRMYDHREADRIPIIDDPWACTLRRWQREGMPAGVDWCDYFDIDKIGVINIGISPPPATPRRRWRRPTATPSAPPRGA